MLFAFLYSVLRLLLDLVDVRLRVHDPEAELLLLRHQLRVVRRQVKRPQLGLVDRTIMAALSLRVNRGAWVGMLVQAETVLSWHRELVRRKWAAFAGRRGPGRPSLDAEVQKLILRIAKENPKWGCVRIRGELLKLGHVVSATAIRNLLRRNRIGPTPLRSGFSWKAFLRAQASAIVLTDFFSVDTVLLKRLYVLLYMDLASRRVIWFAVTDRPDAGWVSQQARNVCWELGEIGVEARFLSTITTPSTAAAPIRCSRPTALSDQDADRSPQGECAHRAPDRFDSARVLGLDANPQPAPSRVRPCPVVRALQRGPSPPGTDAAASDRPLRSRANSWTSDL